MKRFLLDILLVLVLSFVPLYLLQWKIDNNAYKSHGWPYHSVNTAFQGGIDAEVVFFGSSIVQIDMDSDIISKALGKKCFNMGMSGYSFDYQYNLIIKSYLKRNKKPELIVLGVSPQAFLEHWNPDFVYSFLPYISRPEFDFYCELSKDVTQMDRYLPTKYSGLGIGRIWLLLKNRQPSSREDCFTPMHKDTYNVNFPKNYPLEKNPEIIGYLKEFVQNCKRDGIQLVMVLPPMHKRDFYDQCDMEGFYSLLKKTVGEVPLLDYSLLFEKNDEYFYESTHLNSPGAKIFSHKLAQDILELGIVGATDTKQEI
ncbi:MAG: hypothetical protein KBS95_04400 [Alistipes sp.]|nr:hypothetical protein [Candidatus Alistipes equi]